MPPRAAAGEAKQGVVISLVLFVILSIILAVTAYYGFADKAILADKEKEAVQKMTAMQKSRDWEQFEAMLFRVYAGHPGKNDLTDLAKLRADFDGGSVGQGEADRTDIANVVAQLDKRLGWDAAQRKPVRTYSDALGAAEAEVAKMTQDRDRTQQLMKQRDDDHNQTQAAKDDQIKRLQDQLTAAQKANLDLQQAKSAEYLDLLATKAKLDEQVENLTRQIAQLTDDKNREVQKLQGDLADFDMKYKRLESKQPDPNILEYAKPQGRIERLDPSGKLAYINLGSADNVRPQLTFSIIGTEPGGKPKRQRKGSLEIARVLGAHSSMATITQVDNPGRDPVVTGDVLFNPVWSPSLREHVAVAGLIDLNGDGRDDTAEFVRDLERQNVVVDAYLDLKDLSVKGPGLSFKTTYLVIGEVPEFGSETNILKEGDIRFERVREIHNKVTDMRTQAVRLGTTVVPLRRFMALMGFKLPTGGLGNMPADFNLYRIKPATPAQNGTKPPEPGIPQER
jgi:hypothetical protein